MNNFDFHNLLFPTEFETLCMHILEIRENPLKFRTYRRGRDGGIDIKSTNTKQKIIGQCKLYSPQNERGLISNLKKEFLKCKKLKPDRYILCINIHLTFSLSEEILELFKGYIICEEDIIDGRKLNEYLEKPEYEYLFKMYSKLLVPNLKTVEIALEKIINRKFYNNSRIFLLDLINKHKLYHNTEQLSYLIKRLEDDKVIILSGNPGVGKTTTARMIANYFINRKKCEIFYLGENDYAETLGILETNRLIIVDDFWGQNFSPKIKENSTYEREFVSLINNFKTFENSYLILISREYILKDILKNAELETEDIITGNKYIIQLKDYSKEDKIRIFLNHLLFHDFDLAYFKSLSHEDEFEYILDHKNYSPRILEIFIKRYKSEEYQNTYDFYKKLYKYLDNPIEYWIQAFKKLSPTAQLILLVLLVSSDPMDTKDLQQSFDSIQEDARNSLNVQINPFEFETELKKLEEFYISIEKDKFRETFFVKFQSPGIKDYLLEYLRTEGYLWIKSIIKGAQFFNQLTFIFTTQKEKIDDYESEIFLYGEKIVLTNILKKELKHKLLTEFDRLQLSNNEESDFSDQLSKFHVKEETKYFKLLTISKLFNIDDSQNEDVKKFLLSEISKDFETFKINKVKIVANRSMIYFPTIVKRFFSYLNFSKDELLAIFYESITLASEYDYFYDFKEIFPVEFENFYANNILKIRKHIKELIEEEIDFYLSVDKDMELGTFTNFTIEELAKKYRFRLSDKCLKNLENTFDVRFPFLHKEERKSKKNTIPTKKQNRFKQKSYQAVIDEYLPREEETFNPISYLKDKKYNNLILNLKSKNDVLTSFTSSEILFENICDFIISKNIEIQNLSTFEFIDLYISEFTNDKSISSKHLIKFFFEVNKHLEQSNHYSITKSNLKAIAKDTFGFDLKIELLSPIIVSYHHWYKLSSIYFEWYFIAKKLSITQNQELYKQELQDSVLDNCYDITILDFIESANKSKLWEWFINPELDRLLKAIDFTDDKSIILSFINFFQIEFDLSWNKKEKTLEINGSSNSEYHYENIFQWMGIEFYISDFENYFEVGMHANETCERLCMDINMQKDIYNVVTKTIPAKIVNSFITNEEETIFEIKLLDFITSLDNYNLMEKVGLVKYIKQIVKKIINVQLANNYKFSSTTVFLK